MLGLTIQTLDDGDMVIEIHRMWNKFAVNGGDVRWCWTEMNRIFE